MSINTLMPTRGRPDRALEALQSHNLTATTNDSWMTAILDTHDPELPRYQGLMLDVDADVIVLNGNMVQRTNAAVPMVDGDIIGWSADDMIYRTTGWDERVLEAFEDQWVGFVVTNDKQWRGEKAGNVYVRRSVINALGWFAFPQSTHLYIDDVWVQLGRASDSLVYLDDVVVEHMHAHWGKSKNDAGYDEVNKRWRYEVDGAAYSNWFANQLEEDTRKVRECLLS